MSPSHFLSPPTYFPHISATFPSVREVSSGSFCQNYKSGLKWYCDHFLSLVLEVLIGEPGIIFVFVHFHVEKAASQLYIEPNKRGENSCTRWQPLFFTMTQNPSYFQETFICALLSSKWMWQDFGGPITRGLEFIYYLCSQLPQKTSGLSDCGVSRCCF